jgi:hypothetical protein
MKSKKLAVIGGGAAGFFAAITAAENNPEAEIFILEKSTKLLSKVKVSGGGRCNVTNATFENYNLIKNYPRGGKELRKIFDQFSVKDTLKWFETRGVKLKTEEDNRIFPITDNSQTIIDCLLREAEKNKIKIFTGYGVKKIIPPSAIHSKFTLKFLDDHELQFDKIVIATGGYPQHASYHWIEELQQPIQSPVPSLFTFNIPDSKFKDLQGISISQANIKLTGVKSEQEGPVLITHWGLSGPGILRLSAWEARRLSEVAYDFSILINLIPEFNEEKIKDYFNQYRTENPKKIISSNPQFQLPKRLWERLMELAGISPSVKWSDISNKSLNKLMEELIRSTIKVKGKTTFKEEFVTCGGIDLKHVDISTMQSKIVPGLFFAGEVLDIDGITGGFNFQAAWSTGFIAGKNLANS